MSVITSEAVLRLPVRYRLIINLFWIVGRFFGRDERLTAFVTLLRHEINGVASDDESYDAFVDTIADAVKMERRFHGAE
ncbi:hypothetical protein ABIG06_006286 [Bradyrhizobium sp. USDA 326]|uniref:hypothetical protein n=1 Tax=unclassified Bradyrhizobium TaxID=2631580 RepID=UPI003517A1D8